MRLRCHIWRRPAYCGAVVLLATTCVPAHGQLARDIGLASVDTTAADSVALLPTHASFALNQLQNPRVLDARIATRFRIKQMFEDRGIRYPAAEMFVRIFKRERVLEVWVRPEDETRFELLKQYDICAQAGELGPKRRQGDSQVPEGFYAINFFNPQSDYHLSLHVDYPNVRDRMRGQAGISLGGDIFIHGGCSSDGCLALTDEGIMELYWMAVEARSGGQERIPVHIFPARLEADELTRLQVAFRNEPELGAFWSTLRPGYDFFEQHRRLPEIVVDGVGNYKVTGPAENASVPVRALAEPEPAAQAAAPAPKAEEPGRPVPLGRKIKG